jgi:hypothetical protein
MRTPRSIHTFSNETTIMAFHAYENYTSSRIAQAYLKVAMHKFTLERRSLGSHYRVYRSHSHLSDLVRHFILSLDRRRPSLLRAYTGYQTAIGG